jgi:hypothetical protein
MGAKMDQVEFLAFPVYLVSDPFKLFRAGKPFSPFQVPRCSPDWSSKDTILLTQSLNCQIRNNYVDFEQLRVMCHNPEFQDELWTGIYNPTTDESSILKDYYISKEQKKRDCHRFSQRERGYTDVLSRDDDVFNQKGWNTTTYAIILFYGGEYFGHIYAWVSPVDPSTCLGIGIRGRVDSVFREDQLTNVAAYLLEGVRRFAFAKGCKTMIITEPLPVMRKILERMGFQRKSIRDEIIGRSATYPTLTPPFRECYNCYQHPTSESIIGALPVLFNLIP